MMSDRVLLATETFIEEQTSCNRFVSSEEVAIRPLEFNTSRASAQTDDRIVCTKLACKDELQALPESHQ
jgi:hypothetical protein